MEKFRSFIIFSIVLVLLFPLEAVVQAENNSEEEFNEHGIKEGTTIHGIDISEYTEEELQYVPEAWRDGEYEEPHGEVDEDYDPQGVHGRLQSSYPDVNEYIKNMETAEIEYQYKSQFPRFGYRYGVGSPEGVVAHDTGNPNNDKIENEIAWMERNYRNAFVHAFVDHERIIEIHPPNYGAWGAGPIANQRFIHVELVNLRNFHDFARSMNNYSYYIANLLRNYDLGVTSAEFNGQGSLWSHWAVSKHLGGTNSPDPHQYFAKWGYSWVEFMELATEKYNELSVDRIFGDSRYKTAVAVSQDGWNRANTVVLARGDDYADALAGVPLATKHNAPLLLSQSNYFTDVTEKEISRLGADKVYILGGYDAISKEVENEIKGKGIAVERIAGDRRTGTAVKIAEEIGSERAVVVDGYEFADAVSVGAYAAQAGIPILLTQSNQLSQDTKAGIEDLDISETLVVGGPKAVSDKVMNQLPNPSRVAGDDRYRTSVALAEHFGLNTDEYYVATGLDYPDALTSAALAAKNDTGVLLVHREVPDRVRTFLNSNNVNDLSIIGGPLSVSSKVQGDLGRIIK